MKLEHTSHESSGFTLVEMLIVLALLGMLMVILAGTISLGITSRARVTAVSLDEQDFGSFRRILNFELAYAYPDWVSASDQVQYDVVDFYGNTDQLTFLGPALDIQGQGLAHYWISVGQFDGTKTIILKTALSTVQPGATFTTHFASGLQSLRFRYFGRPIGGGAPTWQDSWIDRSTLPDLILVQASFPKGDRRLWPTVVIRPNIDADISCVIDSQTHFCEGR